MAGEERCRGRGQRALFMACLSLYTTPLSAFLPSAPLLRPSPSRHSRHSCSLTMSGENGGAAWGRRAALRLAGFAAAAGGLAHEADAASDVENRDEVRRSAPGEPCRAWQSEGA